jgi:hypothetical protein
MPSSHPQPRWARGSVRRRRASAWLSVTVLLLLAVNPWTARVWWLRSHYLTPEGARQLWGADLAILGVGVMLAAASLRGAGRLPARRFPWYFAVIVLVLDVVFVVACLEAALRWFPARLIPGYSDLGGELRWRAAHVGFRKVGPLTKFSYMGIDTYSPLLGWELKPNLRLWYLHSNARGIRGARMYAPAPAAGSHRVLCLGDSFMFGEGLTDAQSPPAQLESALNHLGHGRWEVLNLAVHGYGTDQAWLRLQHLGFRYKADVVVLGFFEGDLERNQRAFRDYAKPYYEVIHRRLVLRNVPVPSPEEILAREPRWPRVRALWFIGFLWRALVDQVAPLGDLADSRGGRVTLAILDAMLKGVRAHQARFVLVIIPRPILPLPSDTEIMLANWARRTGTSLLVLRKAYLRMPVEEQRRLYGKHWTPYGSAVTAALIAQKILEVTKSRTVTSRPPQLPGDSLRKGPAQGTRANLLRGEIGIRQALVSNDRSACPIRRKRSSDYRKQESFARDGGILRVRARSSPDLAPS